MGSFCPNLTEIAPQRVQSGSGILELNVIFCSVVALSESSDENCYFGVNYSLWNGNIQITTLNWLLSDSYFSALASLSRASN